MRRKKTTGRVAFFLICAMLLLYTGSAYVGAEEAAAGMVCEEELESGENILEGEPETTSEKDMDSEIESEMDFETDSGSESELDFEADSGSGSELDFETDSGSESELDFEADSGSGSEMDFETDFGSGSELDFETDSDIESEISSETETETETGAETDRGAILTEYWQDMTVQRFGINPFSRAAKPVIKRDESLIMGYLDYPCYFKYATNHGMDVGGKTVAVYCVYNTLEAPESETYKPSGTGAFSKEITYCLYNGCRYRGSTAYNSAYSTGNWKQDYYITQVAIHLINNEQGRESSILKQIDKTKNAKIWNLINKMKDDAYADTGLISTADNQSMEVSYQVTPAAQSDWIRQADGSWRTGVDYTAASNHPDRLTGTDWSLGPDAPEGVQITVKDSADPLSPFWFTTTDAAYRTLAWNRMTVSAAVSVNCVEYGGWWYVPVDSSVNRQYVTFLSQGETAMAETQARQVTATVKNQEFRIALKKKDAADGSGLAGAVYGLYSDAAARNLVQTFPPTDGSGVTALDRIAMTQEEYYVREITPPNGYCRDQNIYPIHPAQNPDIQMECSDKERKAMLRVHKEGELLTGAVVTEDGVSFQYERKGLEGAVFDLYAAETIQNARGQVVCQKDALAAGNLITGADGYAQTEALQPGKYYLVEKSAPQYMVTDGEPQQVTLAAEEELTEVQVTNLTVRNQKQRLELQVAKRDDETKNGIAGACFGVFAKHAISGNTGDVLVQAGTLLGKAYSNENGMAVFTVDLPCGNDYVVRELAAPEGYVLDSEWSEEYSFANLPDMAVQGFQAECPEQRYRGTLQIQKVDCETKEPVPQGDAVLEGAQYGLYAGEDIVHPDGHTGVLYCADEQVAVLTTDSDGTAAVEDLYLGKYYLKELVAPEGYVLDENEYELVFRAENGNGKTKASAAKGADNESEADSIVAWSADGEMKNVICRTMILEEQVKKQPFQLLKVSNTGVSNPKPLAGAGFTAWLLSEVLQAEDGSYDTGQSNPAALGVSGETELFTDENGYLCTIPLPYGTYLVRETTVPAEHKPVKEFFVTISEHKPEEPQPWKVFLDDAFDARLKIIKKDSVSKETVFIPGAEFRIWDYRAEAYIEQKTSYPESGMHTSFFTNETGSLILPEPLQAGRYRIEEITAPQGYLVNPEGIEFSISSGMVYRVDHLTGDPIFCFEMEDQPVFGRIALWKSGEQLEDWKQDFVYKKHPLAKTIFAVYAKENVYTPDGQTETDGTRRILYPKGTKAAVIVTDEEGYGITEPLPLGRYQLVEEQAPEGFLPDEKGVEVLLVSQDRETAVVTVEVPVENIRCKWNIRVKKVDKETKKALAGGQFGLYAKEDIRNRNGETVIPADQQIAVCVTDENGTGTFAQDLPLGYYYVKEEQAPDGYVNSHEVQEADLHVSGKLSEAALEKTDEKTDCILTFENVQTEVEISKTDMVDCAEIPGAILTLLDPDGAVIDKWTSGESPHTIRGLQPGQTYLLREETAPFGYLIAEEVTFTVADSGEIQKVTMQDRHAMGRLLIEKQDRQTKAALKGAVFELRTKEGEVLEELVTDRNGRAESGLYEIGRFSGGQFEQETTYCLVETKAPKGYELDSKVYQIHFPYQDAQTEVIEVKQKVSNDKSPVPADRTTVPTTGDDTPWRLAMVLLLLSGLAAVGLGAGIVKKRNGSL